MCRATENPLPEYHKIESLYDRGPDFKVDTSRIRCPEFLQIKDWLVTEKIDGTNIRIGLRQEPMSGGWFVDYRGRTDAAQMQGQLSRLLYDTFTVEKMQSLWRPNHDGSPDEYPITLYGEGYGEKIQKGGGNYRKGQGFRLIDVLIAGHWWLSWENVCDVAAKLGIQTVPTFTVPQRWTLEDISGLVQQGFESPTATQEGTAGHRAEGIVARTDPYLYDGKRRPLSFKLKTSDFTRSE